MAINWKRLSAEVASRADNAASRLRPLADNAASRLRPLADFATDAIRFSSHPTKLGAAGLTLSGLRAVASALSSHDVGALAMTWHPVLLKSAAAAAASRTISDVSEVGASWYYGRAAGQRVAFRLGYDSAGAGSVPRELRAEKDVESFLAYARRTWRERAGRHATLTNAGGVLSTAPPVAVESEVADRIWLRVEPFIRQGKPRSVILTGPPGMGKSCAAQTLARHACDLIGPSATTLRIPVSDLSRADPGAVDGLLDLLPTDVLLIDDIDRVPALDQLLDLMEHCRSRQRLVVVTVNGRLPAALKRPRRAGDEIFEVTGVGRALAIRLLGAAYDRLSLAQLCTVDEWPAAFVSELADRLTTIPGADAEQEIKELTARVRDNECID